MLTEPLILKRFYVFTFPFCNGGGVDDKFMPRRFRNDSVGPWVGLYRIFKKANYENMFVLTIRLLNFKLTSTTAEN